MEPWKLSAVSCSCDLQHNTGDSSCHTAGTTSNKLLLTDLCQHSESKDRGEETLTLVTMNNTLARMQTLVGQAGEALGITEDPLGTVVGARVGAGVWGRGHTAPPCVADTGGHQGGAGHGGLGPQHGDL